MLQFERNEFNLFRYFSRGIDQATSVASPTIHSPGGIRKFPSNADRKIALPHCKAGWRCGISKSSSKDVLCSPYRCKVFPFVDKSYERQTNRKGTGCLRCQVVTVNRSGSADCPLTESEFSGKKSPGQAGQYWSLSSGLRQFSPEKFAFGNRFSFSA